MVHGLVARHSERRGQWRKNWGSDAPNGTVVDVDALRAGAPSALSTPPNSRGEPRRALDAWRRRAALAEGKSLPEPLWSRKHGRQHAKVDGVEVLLLSQALHEQGVRVVSVRACPEPAPEPGPELQKQRQGQRVQGHATDAPAVTVTASVAATDIGAAFELLCESSTAARQLRASGDLVMLQRAVNNTAHRARVARLASGP